MAIKQNRFLGGGPRRRMIPGLGLGLGPENRAIALRRAKALVSLAKSDSRLTGPKIAPNFLIQHNLPESWLTLNPPAVSYPVNAASSPNEAMESAAEDARLVGVARGGDQDAFDRLVERYRKRAVAVSYRLLGSIHDAADVAQDAFLRAYQKLDKLEDPRRFGPWLMRIVTNLSLNFRRSRSRSSAMSTEDVIEGENDMRTASGALFGSSEGESAGARELREAVSAAVDALPEKQRLALVLFSMEGLPQKEVAEIMHCTVELVKWNVFQARKTLRKNLALHLEG